MRVAWWRGLGGIPFEPEVRRVVDANRAVFEQLGCIVEEAEPAFDGVDEAFPTLRHLSYHSNYAALAQAAARVGQGHDSLGDCAKPSARRAPTWLVDSPGSSACTRTPAQFFERYEYFILPVTQVLPFDVNIAYPTSIDGTPMATYIDWMRSCWYVTFMACPAISVPGGFSSGGLPVGLQIVGRHRADWSVLQLAHAFEQATGHGKKRPA